MENQNSIKSFFNFTKDQRKGILILFVIIIGLQLTYFFVDFNKEQKTSKKNKLGCHFKLQ